MLSGVRVDPLKMCRKSSNDVNEWFLYLGLWMRSEVSIKISQAKVKAALVGFFW